MKSVYRPLFPLLVAAATAPVFAAEMTLFEHESFSGRGVTVNQSVADFANFGINDQASSVVIRSGAWQLCSDSHFRGHCVTLSPGQYPNLAAMGLNDAVSSARELGVIGGGGAVVAVGDGRVQLFDGINFQFRSLPVSGALRNFGDVDFNDRAASMIVLDGTWEACTDADFRGLCRIYGPGRYPDLDEMNGRISSIRQVSGGGGGGGGAVIVGGGGGGAWAGGARATLYARPNLGGRSFTISNEIAANLADMGFNDRASSLRVEAGYWIFCTDANFHGDCRTFGPGDYPTLPWGLQNQISSGRRIYGQYPYTQNPNWTRP